MRTSNRVPPHRPLTEPLESRQMLSATLTAGSSLMVFNAVDGSTSQVETLTLTNTGDAALSLTGASVVADPTAAADGSSRFAVVNGSSLPATLAAGAAFGLTVDYTAGLVGLQYAVLDVASSDPATPTTAVLLHGIGTAGLGGNKQPSLMRVLHAYDEPNYASVGETDETNALYPEPPAADSDEVDLQEMVKAGPGDVTFTVLASFVAAATKPYILGWYDTANVAGTMQQLFYTPTAEWQSTYVQPQGTTSFDPGSTVFGLYDPSQTVKVNGALVTGYTQDALNTYDTTDPRKFRFFPLEDADGTVVPDSYIMTSTEWPAPIGYDFVNIIAVVTNVKPATPTPTPAPASVTVTAAAAQAATAGVASSFDLGGFAEAGGTAPYTVAVDWGDGSPPTTFAAAAAGAIGSRAHTYVAAGTDTVSVTVTDAAGVASGAAAFTATVAAPPTGLVPTAGKSTLPAAVVGGLPVKGSVAVSVRNDTAGTETGTGTVALYATTTGTAAGGTLVGSVSKRLTLKAGGSVTVAVPVKSLSVAAGTYTLLARATDAAGTAIAATAGPVVTVADPVVSLRPTVTGVAPAAVPPGKAVALTLTVANGGNVVSAGVATIAVGLSTDGTSFTLAVSSSTKSLKIKAGGKVVLRLRVTVPATQAAGVIYPFVTFAQGTGTFRVIATTRVTVR